MKEYNSVDIFDAGECEIPPKMYSYGYISKSWRGNIIINKQLRLPHKGKLISDGTAILEKKAVPIRNSRVNGSIWRTLSDDIPSPDRLGVKTIELEKAYKFWLWLRTKQESFPTTIVGSFVDPNVLHRYFIVILYCPVLDSIRLVNYHSFQMLKAITQTKELWMTKNVRHPVLLGKRKLTGIFPYTYAYGNEIKHHKIKERSLSYARKK